MSNAATFLPSAKGTDAALTRRGPWTIGGGRTAGSGLADGAAMFDRLNGPQTQALIAFALGVLTVIVVTAVLS